MFYLQTCRIKTSRVTRIFPEGTHNFSNPCPYLPLPLSRPLGTTQVTPLKTSEVKNRYRLLVEKNMMLLPAKYIRQPARQSGIASKGIQNDLDSEHSPSSNANVRLFEKAWLHSLRVQGNMAESDGDTSQNLPGFVDLNDLACSRVSGFYALLEIRLTIS